MFSFLQLSTEVFVGCKHRGSHRIKYCACPSGRLESTVPVGCGKCTAGHPLTQPHDRDPFSSNEYVCQVDCCILLCSRVHRDDALRNAPCRRTDQKLKWVPMAEWHDKGKCSKGKSMCCEVGMAKGRGGAELRKRSQNRVSGRLQEFTYRRARSQKPENIGYLWYSRGRKSYCKSCSYSRAMCCHRINIKMQVLSKS